MRRLVFVGLLAAALAVMPGAAQAATLQIQFGGVNYQYNGTYLCDAPTCNGAPGTPNFANADPLNAMQFVVGGTQVGAFGVNDGLGVDFQLYYPGLAIGVNSGTGGFLDLYVQQTWGLALNLSTWDIIMTSTGSPAILGVTGVGTVALIWGQSLPFGLTMGMPVQFSFSGTNVTGTLANFTATGTGEVSGPAIPEPGSMMLLGTGLIGLAGAVRRRIKK